MQLSVRQLSAVGSAMYALLVLVLLIRGLSLNHGQVVYPLDDPYIHLDVAENLAKGHYGLNLGEPSSPSSSIAWPFMLVPFAGTPLHLYMPLILNIVFGFAAMTLIAYFICRWPPQPYDTGAMSAGKQVLTVGLLMFCANLPGLTVLGMEHVSQIVLAVCCAIGIATSLDGRPMPAWCIAAAVIAPMIRYEDLALTFAVGFALLGCRRYKAALTTAVLSLTPLVAFSFYLMSKGLPPLPSSVLAKSDAYGNSHFLHKMGSMLYGNLASAVTNPEHLPVFVLTAIFITLAWQSRHYQRRITFIGVAAAGSLQLAIGRFGWGHRYEVYALLFLLLVCLKVLSEGSPFLFGYFALGLVACASSYIRGTAELPGMTHDIYNQQFLMRRFVTEFYHGNYAVNDIGLTAFQRRPGSFVLDLYGLGSIDALRHPDRPAPWLVDIVHRHDVHLAMLYPSVVQPPSTWTSLATMCIRHPLVNFAAECVVFYSTDPAYNAELRTDFDHFIAVVPDEVEIRTRRE